MIALFAGLSKLGDNEGRYTLVNDRDLDSSKFIDNQTGELVFVIWEYKLTERGTSISRVKGFIQRVNLKTGKSKMIPIEKKGLFDDL